MIEYVMVVQRPVMPNPAAMIAILCAGAPAEPVRHGDEPMPILPPRPLRLEPNDAPPWARDNRRKHYRQSKPGGLRR